MRTDREGQVWEHAVAPGTMLLILNDAPHRSPRYGVIQGWRCVNLMTGCVDWMPDSCFDSHNWRKIA